MPYVSINDKKMHYLDQGSGPVLLFGHSFLWDHNMWREQVAVFSKNYRCIVPDLWGHGQSSPLSSETITIAQLGQDHLQLMDSLNVEKFSLIGLSVGGMWGAEVAIQAKARLTALVMMDTFVGAEPEASKMRYFGMLDAVEKASCIPPPMIDALMPIFFSPNTLKNKPELVSEFRTRLSSYSPEQINSIVTLGRGIFSRDDRLAALAEIDIPTLILCGEFDQPRPVDEAKRMDDCCSRSEFKVVPGAGHISCLESTDVVNAFLSDFLGAVS